MVGRRADGLERELSAAEASANRSNETPGVTEGGRYITDAVINKTATGTGWFLGTDKQERQPVVP